MLYAKICIVASFSTNCFHIANLNCVTLAEPNKIEITTQDLISTEIGNLYLQIKKCRPTFTWDTPI